MKKSKIVFALSLLVLTACSKKEDVKPCAPDFGVYDGCPLPPREFKASVTCKDCTLSVNGVEVKTVSIVKQNEKGGFDVTLNVKSTQRVHFEISETGVGVIKSYTKDPNEIGLFTFQY